MAEAGIKLQSSVGEFDADFLEELPLLEKAMIERDLDPSDFIIAKNRPQTGQPILIGGSYYDYTVFVADQSFTVTMSNDLDFLDYFHQRCVAPDERVPVPTRGDRYSPARSLQTVIGRLARWLSETPG